MRYDVTREIADRYGLDLAACHGERFGHHHFHRERYHLVGRGEDVPAELSAVHVRRWHNFGNQLVQLCNALAFARAHDLAVISGPETPWFREGRVEGVRLVLGRTSQRDLLEGPFFYRHPIGLPHDPALAQQHATRLRKLFTVEPAEERRPRQLVIHVRSGDVFGANPHPDYAPPPLGYYLSAIEQADPRRVLLVSQDLHHPFLGLLEEACRARSVEFAVQADSLAEDLRALISASMLCLSQGTMGVAVALLSRRIRKIFVPSLTMASRLAPLGGELYADPRPNALKGSWTASPEQVAALVADDRPHPLELVAPA